MTQKVEVLGGGFVELLDHMGSDLTVVNAARVSFGKRKVAFDDKDEKLINYLAKHNHWTPFSQCQVQLHFKMPIFIARQYFKHSVGLTRNEISRRYVKSSPEFFKVTDLRLSAENVKQGSSDKLLDNSLNNALIVQIEKQFEKCAELYQTMLEAGVCAEQARMVLPVATHTEFIETGSLSAYSRIFNLRAEKTAQKEIQEYALAINQIIEPIFPVSWKALMSSK